MNARADTKPADLGGRLRSRSRRLLLRGFIGVVGLGILLGLARWYLASRHVTASIAYRLQGAYGGTVRLAGASLGWGSSSLHDLQLFETEAGAPDEPWAVIEDVRADVSAWRLIGGEMPPQLTLSGAAMTLRFDKAGHLSTRIPDTGGKSESLPAVKIELGSITLRQEGRPDFVVSGIQADLSDGGQLVLTGTAADPAWGDWIVNGSVDRKTGAGSATLKTTHVHVTQEMLERLPFVPSYVWQQVQCEGDTPVELTVRFDPAARTAHYRVVLEPEATTVNIPSIDLSADQARGKVVIEDDLVKLDGVQGKAAKGALKTDANLEFRHTPSELTFKVDADQLELGRLPKSWRLPQLGGRLSGHADLQITLADGQIRTQGDGQGELTGAGIAGVPFTKPILLRLHSEGNGFRFSHQAPAPNKGARAPSPVPAPLVVALQVPPAAPPPSPLLSPTQLVNWFGNAVVRAIEAVTQTGTDLVARLPKAGAQPAKPQEAPSYLEASLGLDDVDVEQLVRGLGVQLPVPVSGRISFQVQVAFPIDTPRDLRAYRIRGRANAPGLKVADLELQQVRARVTYADGVLRLEELSGRMPPDTPAASDPGSSGSFQGSARLGVVPQGDLTARLTLDAIPLERVLSLVPATAEQAQGRFSGNIQVDVPAARLREINTWTASGTIAAEYVQAYGLVLKDATAEVRFLRGHFSIADAHGQLEGTPVAASAELQLADPYRFSGEFSVRKGDLAALLFVPKLEFGNEGVNLLLVPKLEFENEGAKVRPPVALRGNIDATADFKGTLQPPTVQTSGAGTAADLEFENLKIGSVKFGWESDAEQLRVTDVRASLNGGELTGKAVIPLRATSAGTVDLRFKDLDVGALSKAVPSVPIHLEGRATGTLEGTVTAAAPGRKRELTSKLDLQAPHLLVQGIPAERSHGTVDYRNKTVIYQAEGETLGGRFHLNGLIPPAGAKPAEPPPPGHFRLEGARLGRLWRAVRAGTALSPLGGIVDLDVTFRQEGAGRAPVGGGHFVMDHLRWLGTDFVGSMRGDVVLTEREVRLRNLTGQLGQGLMRGQIAINLRQINRSWFNLAVDQVEAARLLTPWPALATHVQGALQARLRGTLGRACYGSGEVALVHGKVSGVDVAEWRLPFDWAVVPGRGSGQIEFRESAAHIALGRVASKASLSWGAGTRLEGQVRFYGVELRTLLRQITDLSQLGTGQVTGRIDFGGRDVRSVDDLTATIEATFQQTQALQLPVLRHLAPFLMPGPSAAAVFENGSLRGRLAGGVFRIERLTFAGSVMQLFIDGSVTREGRLNLEVTANTGLVGVSYFANRLLHLRMAGTLRSPIVTVEPLSLLPVEALRFFLNR